MALKDGEKCGPERKDGRERYWMPGRQIIKHTHMLGGSEANILQGSFVQVLGSSYALNKRSS